MSFCLRPNVCKKCGKPLTMFEGWTCLECEKAEQEPQKNTLDGLFKNIKKWEKEAEQEPKAIIREAIEDYVCNYLTDTAKAQKILNALQDMEQELKPINCVEKSNLELICEELAAENDRLIEELSKMPPIPDNATNGDVIRTLFEPNRIRRMDDVVSEEYEFDEVWWNAPYQKGGKE